MWLCYFRLFFGLNKKAFAVFIVVSKATCEANYVFYDSFGMFSCNLGENEFVYRQMHAVRQCIFYYISKLLAMVQWNRNMLGGTLNFDESLIIVFKLSYSYFAEK